MKKALISVSDKTNLEFLARSLYSLDFEIIATTSTAKSIRSYDIPCKTVEEVTGFYEILDGRVKTLHPHIHGGILANLSLEKHRRELEHLGIPTINLVVCNLYPFEEVLKKEAPHQELIENIDIGGVTLIRASSKNNEHVTTLCDPMDYQEVINELINFGEVTETTRLKLAMKGFILTAEYDIAIANYFQRLNNSNEHLLLSATKKETLRYGENQHQEASYYSLGDKTHYSVESSEILWGKPLSYNNILDIDACLMTLKEFYDTPCCVAIKHNTPCGVGLGETALDAYINAYNVDPVSIFGGIVAFNKEVNEELATKLNETFLEVVIAPSFTDDAFNVLSKKKNLRIIKISLGDIGKSKEIKSVQDGLLVQDKDLQEIQNEKLEVVTKNESDIDFKTLIFLQKVCKFAKSNAIVVGQKNKVLGIGSGEVNRIDACKMAVERAINNVNYSKNEPLCLASDAFFPFDDIIDYIKDFNIKYVIQPGGSMNDGLVIDKANDACIEMVFTNTRHFKH